MASKRIDNIDPVLDMRFDATARVVAGPGMHHGAVSDRLLRRTVRRI